LPTDEGLRQRLRQREAADLYQELKSRDPARASEIHPHDKFRLVRALELLTLLGHPVRDLPRAKPPLAARLVVLDPPRAVLHERIAKRTDKMLAQGLVAEVQGLLASG